MTWHYVDAATRLLLFCIQVALLCICSLSYIQYLSSRWELPCTEHPVCSSPGSTLSASASSAVWIISGWYGWRTLWNSGTPSHRSLCSSLKILYRYIATHYNVLSIYRPSGAFSECIETLFSQTYYKSIGNILYHTVIFQDNNPSSKGKCSIHSQCWGLSMTECPP